MAPRPPGHAFVLALYRAFSRLHSAYAFPSSHRDGVAFNNPHVFGHGDIPEEEPGSVGFWTHLLISVALVLAGGVFAGYVRLFFSFVSPTQGSFLANVDCFTSFSLTLGLMGLDELHLRVLSTSSDDPAEKKNAQTGELSHPQFLWMNGFV